MKLALRQKEAFFSRVATLLKSGHTPERSLEVVAARRDAVGQIAKILLPCEHGIAEAMRARREVFTGLDVTLMEAGEKGGRMPDIAGNLAQYYGTIAAAVEKARRALAYPVFLLHFAIVVLAVPALVTTGGKAFISMLWKPLAVVYGLTVVAVFVWRLLIRLQSRVAMAWKVIRRIPAIGPLQEAVAAERFCRSAGLQIRAGISVLRALESAAQATAVGAVQEQMQGVLKNTREGVEFAQALDDLTALPEEVVESLRIGAVSGYLDARLEECAELMRARMVGWAEIIAEWLPRIIYIMVVLYTAWRILSIAQGYTQEIQKHIDAYW